VSELNIVYLCILLESLLLQVSTAVTFDEVVPGLKTSFSFKVPDQKSGKVGVFSFRGTINFTENMGSWCCSKLVMHSASLDKLDLNLLSHYIFIYCL
jgi:hypothetical protein